MLVGFQALVGILQETDDGVGASFRERKHEWVQFPECVANLVVGSLAAYLQAHYGMVHGNQWETTSPSPDPKIYMFSLPRATWLVGFPVEGYWGRATTRTNL